MTQNIVREAIDKMFGGLVAVNIDEAFVSLAIEFLSNHSKEFLIHHEDGMYLASVWDEKQHICEEDQILHLCLAKLVLKFSP